MKTILVIDQGTTSTRAILYSTDASVVASHQIELKQYFPAPGWVEHDPEEIWSAVITCCKEVLKEAEIQDVIGLGITNQRETSVVWERDSGKPIYPAIVWQDRRNVELCQRLKHLEPDIYKKTGLLLDPYFCAIKIHWILHTIPGSMAKAENGELLFGTIDSYLLWRLTSGKAHNIDITNASRTLLFNIVTKGWDKELLDIFEIPAPILPSVKENCGLFGVTDKSLFDQELPILAMIGDQQAAMIGQGCLLESSAKATYGTGCFLMTNTGKEILPSEYKLLNTIAYKIDGKTFYAREGSIFAAGSIIKWFRDKLGIIQHSRDSEALARKVADNGGVYFVPAFTGLGAPYWDPMVRGAIFGLNRDSSSAHLVRAGLEAIAYQTKDLLLDKNCVLQELKVDGGVTANKWLLQFLADILQIPIKPGGAIEATALGAAYLVLYAAGYIKRLTDIISVQTVHKVYYPQMTKDDALCLYKHWQEAVNKARGNL